MKEKKIVLKVFSLLPTPLLLFFSSALSLYLSNQAELNFQWAVLLPFIYAAAGLFFLGLALLQFGRSRFSDVLIWLYYLSGPTVLVFTLLGELSLLNMESGLSLGIFSLISICGLIFICRKFDYKKATPLFALFGFLLLLQDSFSIVRNIRFDEEGRESKSPTVYDKHLPNIYHLVLDKYQSDFFDMQLSDALEQDLNGFNYYPNASALYSMTVWSIASMFLGEEYAFSESAINYQSRAFYSEQSFLSSLKKAGYSTTALTRKLYPFELGLFDQTIVHSKNSGSLAVDNSDAFIALWIYRVLPGLLSYKLAHNGIFLDIPTYNTLENRTFLADSAPQESMFSYLNYLSQEQYLPARGRYVYIHLLLPHEPFIYNAECDESSSSSMLEQSRCGTTLLLKLVAELKRLNRYEQSLIIVNGDHGTTYRKRGPQWVEGNEGNTHRSLLLIKPANTDSNVKFNRVNSDVSIVDIAQGLKDFALGQDDKLVEPPWWRSNKMQQSQQGERYFYRVSDFRDLMDRYLVNAAQELEFQERRTINTSVPTEQFDPNRAAFPVNSIIEAENGLLSGAVEIGENLPDTHGSYVTFGTKSYSFELKEDARLEVQIRAISPNGNSNSTFIRVNDTPIQIWSLAKSKRWKWHQYEASVQLNKGNHTLFLEYREPIYIDQLELIVTPLTSEEME